MKQTESTKGIENTRNWSTNSLQINKAARVEEANSQMQQPLGHLSNQLVADWVEMCFQSKGDHTVW